MITEEVIRRDFWRSKARTLVICFRVRQGFEGPLEVAPVALNLDVLEREVRRLSGKRDDVVGERDLVVVGQLDRIDALLVVHRVQVEEVDHYGEDPVSLEEFGLILDVRGRNP